MISKDEDSDNDLDRDRPTPAARPVSVSTIPSVAQALLPSTICSSLAEIVKLLDDHSVTGDGTAVYQAAYHAIWSFLGRPLFEFFNVWL